MSRLGVGVVLGALCLCAVVGAEMQAQTYEPEPEVEVEREWEEFETDPGTRGDGGWIQGVFWSAYLMILCAVRRGWCWLMMWILDVFHSLTDTVFELMPWLTIFGELDFGPLFTAWHTANVFLPVGEAATAVAAYGSWKAVLITVRFIKKWIPTLAG